MNIADYELYLFGRIWAKKTDFISFIEWLEKGYIE